MFEIALVMGLPIRQGNVRSRVGTGIIGIGPDQTVIRALFDDVGRPASDPGDHKQRRKHRGGNTTQVIGAGAVKIEIWKKFFLAPHHLLDALGYRVKSLVAVRLGELFGPCLDDVGTRVGNLINAMAEAHDELFSADEFENASFCIIGCVEMLDEFHGGFIGSSVQRAPQRADSASDGGIEVRQGRGDGAGGESGGIEFMLGVENQGHIDGAAVELIGLLAVQHMEELPGYAVIVRCRFNPFAALVKVVPVEQHRAKAGSQPVGYGDLVARRPFGLQSPEHRTTGTHHIHGVSADRNLFEYRLERCRQPAHFAQRFLVIV